MDLATGSCEGKKKYPSYLAAIDSSNRLKRRREAKVNAYRHEDHWHVGNTMGKKRFKNRPRGKFDVRKELPI